MTTTTDRAASRMPRAAARCASIAREAYGVLSIAISGFVAFCAGAALIGFHVVSASFPGPLAAAALAVAVFLADRFLSTRFPAGRYFSRAIRAKGNEDA